MGGWDACGANVADMIPSESEDTDDDERPMKLQRYVDEHRGMSAVVVWQSTAYTLRQLACVLRLENKPLFGAFNTRQV